MEDVTTVQSAGNSEERRLSAVDAFTISLGRQGLQSPIVRSFARNIMRKWREAHERTVNKRLHELRLERKRKEGDAKDIARLVTRKVPIDLLAHDWLNNNQITADARVYLVENLLPTLILGVDKLLTEVSKRGLADSEGFCPDFNPINFLAQYLMRNNLKYSNFVEASPYTKGLHKVIEDLKKDIFSSEENKLAKMKEEARNRRLEREKLQKLRDLEDRRRSFAIEEQFIEWTADWKGIIPIAAVQNMLMSFQEFAANLPEEIRKGADYCIPLQPTDTTGLLVDLSAFKEYLKPYGGNLSVEAFSAFLRHMSFCAKEYRSASIRQAMRNVLQNLFFVCDVNGVNQLDRQRVLGLLGLFYDGASDVDRDILRNPRQWPVIEIEEINDEDEYIVEEEKKKKSKQKEKQEKPQEQKPQEEKPQEEKSQEEKSQKGKSQKEKSQEEKPQEEKSQKEKSQEKPQEEKSQEEKSQKKKSQEEKPQEEKPQEEKSQEEKSQKEKSQEEKPWEEKPRDEVQKPESEDKVTFKEPATTGDANDKTAQPGQTDNEAEQPAEPAATGKEPQATQEPTQGPKQEVASQEEVTSKEEEVPKVVVNPAPEEKEEEKKDVLTEEDKKLLDSIPEEFDSSEDSETEASVSIVLKPETEIEGSAFDENTLNQSQFIHLTEKFLGDEPKKQILEKFVRFVRSYYVEYDFETLNRINKARKDARSAKRRRLVDHLFDLWDIDASGFLEVEKIQVVLNKWKIENLDSTYKEAVRIFSEVKNKLGRKELRDVIDSICKVLPEEEDTFEPLVQFLTSSVERSFEERRRSETRKRWLTAIDVAAQTSGAQLDPVYNAVFQVLHKDAEEHGRGKVVSCFVSMLENNDDYEMLSRGETVLRYAACTAEDIGYMLGKVLYRDMKAVSWAAVDSGKPIHVPKVAGHRGVHFWNSFRNNTSDGSFIVLPLKDHEKRVIGLLGIDTLCDPHKAVFITHEITFFQATAKALSQAIQFVDIRRKTLRVAESAVSWILRRSQNVQDVNVYLVEPGLRPADGLVLRRMMLLGHNGLSKRFTNNPPRLDRKDNLFRDYLFKCVESSETITADAYGERHMAFPLRDAEGHAVAVVDISIGNLKALPPDENKEIQRMLRLLTMAHREVAREVAGMEKNIVLEVEKEYEDARIDVLFDRLMLLDLRENVGRLDARAFAEIKSYKDPPKVIHDILRAVLGIFNNSPGLQARFEEWTTCKQYVNPDLVKHITSYDPTARSSIKVDAKSLAKTLQDVPQGAVAKHGSLPAQYLFNWAFVCLSLIEHTEKMAESRPGKVVSPPTTSSLMVDPGRGRKDSPPETINTPFTNRTATPL